MEKAKKAVTYLFLNYWLVFVLGLILLISKISS